MKGQAIISGKVLTLSFITLLILMTTACFTIVTNNTRQPDPTSDFTQQSPESSDTSSVPDLPSPGHDSENSYELKIIVDPSQAARSLKVSPKGNGRGAYSAGTEVTIDVERSPGWEIERWIGPVYETLGDVAKIRMDQHQSIRVLMVQTN
jgi:hypothetical protein